MKIKAILDFIKTELERNCNVKDSFLRTFGKSMLGNHCDNFEFEDYQGNCVSIMYWDSGIIIIGFGNIITDVDYLFYEYTPENYQDKVFQNKLYPIESEEIFVKKMNELLDILNKENPNIMSQLPNDI